LEYLESKFLRDHAAHGNAQQVRALHAGNIKNGGGIRGHQGDGIGVGRDIALANAAIVESDGAIALAEDGAAAMPHEEG
jgi:hypothetical protein